MVTAILQRHWPQWFMNKHTLIPTWPGWSMPGPPRTSQGGDPGSDPDRPLNLADPLSSPRAGYPRRIAGPVRFHVAADRTGWPWNATRRPDQPWEPLKRRLASQGQTMQLLPGWSVLDGKALLGFAGGSKAEDPEWPSPYRLSQRDLLPGTIPLAGVELVLTGDARPFAIAYPSRRSCNSLRPRA